MYAKHLSVCVCVCVCVRDLVPSAREGLPDPDCQACGRRGLVCVLACVCARACVFVFVFVCMRACVCVRAHARMHACVRGVRVCVWPWVVSVYVYVHVCAYVIHTEH